MVRIRPEILTGDLEKLRKEIETLINTSFISLLASIKLF